MEIGGVDVRFESVADETTLKGCLEIVNSYWQKMVIEEVFTRFLYREVNDMPLKYVEEVFLYQDEAARVAWNEDCQADNKMIHLIVQPDKKCLTVVVDDRDTEEMRSILLDIKEFIETDR